MFVYIQTCSSYWKTIVHKSVETARVLIKICVSSAISPAIDIIFSRITSKHLFLQCLYYARFTSLVNKRRPYNFTLDRVMLVYVSVRPFFRWYLLLWTFYFRIYSLVFPEILDSDRNLETEKNDSIRFSRKFLFALKWTERDQNEPKTEFSWVFIKFCQYILLKVAYNERSYNSQCKQMERFSVIARGSDYFLSLDDKSKQRYKVKIKYKSMTLIW